MAANNYFGFTHNGTQYSALSATAYAAPAQTAYVQQTQTAYMATPRAQAYEAYQTPHAAQQYAYSAVGARTQVVAPVVQATPQYDTTKTYYAPIANVTPGAAAAASATVYALPTDTTYQANKFQPLYDSTKKYYPVAPVAAPPAVPTTMYTVTAEPIYQTLAVGNSKSVYMPNTYTTQNQGRQITAVKIHTSLPTSIPSYTYQPPTQVSVIPAVTVTVTATTPKAITTATCPAVADATIYTGAAAYQPKFSSVSSSGGISGVGTANTVATAYQNKKPYHFHHRQRVTPKAPQLHYCDVCKISCAGPQTYREHLEGQKHKKKEASAKVSSLSTNSSSSVARGGLAQLHCKMCDVACTGADTYAAHVRGAKHQKVLKLHASLGKPIPAAELANMKKISSSEDVGNSSSKTGSTLSKQDSSQGSSSDKFKSSKSEDDNRDDLDSILRSEKDVQPVGQEYIDEARNETGTAVSFYCKLCDCKFTDPNAKIMHMKGRRHRLQYKKKVDPSLQVDVKPLYGRRNLQQDEMSHRPNGNNFRRRQYEDKMRMEWEQRRYEEEMMEYHRQMNPVLSSFGMKLVPARRPDSYNDRHVLTKHTTIYPTAAELDAVQSTVSTVEKALQLVSDHLAEKNDKGPEGRPLKGVMRVGSVAKGLVLHDNLDLELVALCVEKPTRSLLENVVDNITKQLAEIAVDEYEVEMCVENAGLTIRRLAEPVTRCSIYLTSPVVREELMTEPSGNAVSDPPDVLDRQKCLNALAELRHAKWFQAKAGGLQSCVIIIRIMRDFCKRIPTWTVLEGWPLELLVEKCVSSSTGPLSPGDALRRVFECIASGILLPGGPGLFDPCEKDRVDAMTNVSDQLKEDITTSAQQALRQIAFQQIHSVLGMEQLPPPNGNNLLSRKRQRNEDDAPFEVEDAKIPKQE